MRRLLLAAVIAAGLFAPRSSDAAERWVDRPMTLHRLVFAGDVGLGVGHTDTNLTPSITGAGLNLEGALGVTDNLELGLRTGIRFGDDGRFTGADGYGRTLWTETYGTGSDTFANPELRVRWVAYSGSIAEVGLDGRVFLPVESGTRFGMMFGVPLAFHASDFLRIDTGAYIPVISRSGGAFNGVTMPGYFWFQTSEKLWLGPMAAIRIIDPGGPFGDHDVNLLAGFGLGYQALQMLDLKFQVFAPAIDEVGLDIIGFGFGAQFRIGE
ncbi:MAG: hypothetical protein KIT84_43740 [Labilithrix sp.]|nr:hypothetical protein [Labilithrix sp.]MCW5817993.1 hypothetical protein [Labilithrix sp.]